MMISKKQFAGILRRYPWLAYLIIRLYRLTRTRYSAGVVGVLLNTQNQVLLVEHVFHPSQPWGLPGGWIGNGEEPADALCREFKEELQLDVQTVRPLLIQQGYKWRNHLDIAFLLECTTPLDEITLSSELTSFNWFALDDLPPMNSFNFRVMTAVKKMIEQVQ